MATLTPPKKRPQILDINVLPQEYRQTALSSRSWLFVMVILVAGFSIYSLLPALTRARAETAQFQANVEDMRQEIKTLQAQDPQVKELKAALGKLEAKKKELLAGWELFQKGKARWPLVLDGIQGSLPSGVNINALSQKGTELTVDGLAPSLAVIVEYANSLRRLGLASDLGITYENVSPGVLSFHLRLVIKAGGAP